MQAEAICNEKDEDEMDPDKMHPMKPGPKDSTLSRIAIQPQPDAVATASNIATSSSRESHFTFLDLPPEIRNQVYRHPRIYRTRGSWRFRGISFFPDLRQAPITRVNKKIRGETLPMFYGNHRFVIQLPTLPKAYDGPSKDQDPLESVWEMLYAFTPVRKTTPQVNSLHFLSHLTFRLEIQSSSSWDLTELGFTMSSRDLIHDDKGQHFVQTAGLNWHRSLEVKEAYTVAIGSCSIAEEADFFLDLDVVDCPQVDKATNELAVLMCCISRECPQLASNILAFVEAGEKLYDFLEERW